jgi:hypothetical protein
MKKLVAGVFGAVGSAPLFAAGISDLTSQIDFSDAITAIVAVGAALAAVFLLYRAVDIVLAAIRGKIREVRSF